MIATMTIISGLKAVAKTGPFFLRKMLFSQQKTLPPN